MSFALEFPRPSINKLNIGMSNYTPALDATRVLPGGYYDHHQQIERLLAHLLKLKPIRHGVTADTALEEERAAGWLIEGLCQAAGYYPPVALAFPRSRAAYTASAQQRVPFAY